MAALLAYGLAMRALAAVVLVACRASDVTLPVQASPQIRKFLVPGSCQVVSPTEYCAAGPPQRSVRAPKSSQHLLSTDGRTVFYETQRADYFDLETLKFAHVDRCSLWGDVYAWDKKDVYILGPQSCGGENCGGDYTGYYWSGLSVKSPNTFRWLAGGYGVDDQFVYFQWNSRIDEPLHDARSADFELFICGPSSARYFVGKSGEHFFRDDVAGRAYAREVSTANAFDREIPADAAAD